jgi:Domain of unknown function (DUF397)
MQTLSAPWRKSSYSGNGGQSCVEAASDSAAVLIRDTKNHGHGPVLRFTPRAFADFTTRIRQDAAL